MLPFFLYDMSKYVCTLKILAGCKSAQTLFYYHQIFVLFYYSVRIFPLFVRIVLTLFSLSFLSSPVPSLTSLILCNIYLNQKVSWKRGNVLKTQRAKKFLDVQGQLYVLGHKITSIQFHHISKRFQKKMIPHLKAILQSSLNQERNWEWHHPGDGHAHLIEKATLLLNLVWSLS